ncbi:hypothetical protein ABK040_013813 [Willaertia magna]
MRLTVVNEISGDVQNVEIDPNQDTVEELKALIEVNSKIPINQQELFFQNFPMKDEHLLNKYQLTDDEIVVLNRKRVVTQPPLQQQRNTMTPPNTTGIQPSTTNTGGGMVTEDLLNNIFSSIQPTTGGSRTTQQQPQYNQREIELQRRLQQNPYDIEAQQLLEEEIRMKNIQENYLNALEHTPESFFSVHMLYIPCKVNNLDLKAFVDSGAQMSIMSKSCAEKCGLMRLLDTRYKGVAKGVGSCAILGRVHLALLHVGKSTLPISITVLDQGGMQFLLGLDMLKRHQMMIDLKDNCLRVGEEAITFLPQHECPNEIQDIESPKPTTSDISRPNPFEMNQNSNEKETVIKQLMENLGVDRNTVVKALELAKGNAELAASLLYEQKFGQ